MPHTPTPSPMQSIICIQGMVLLDTQESLLELTSYLILDSVLFTNISLGLWSYLLYCYSHRAGLILLKMHVPAVNAGKSRVRWLGLLTCYFPNELEDRSCGRQQTLSRWRLERNTSVVLRMDPSLITHILQPIAYILENNSILLGLIHHCKNIESRRAKHSAFRWLA